MPESSCSGISDSMESQQQRNRKNHRVYAFTINILKVTRIPSPMRLSFSAGSSFKMPSKRTLKITVLHGSKQKEIGEFDIVQDQCIIDQRISCRLFCAKEDDLGKLHIYIDQAYSSGLAGHIALDLKEFLQDMDTEVYIKYPLSASSPREGYVPKLKMTLECTCLGNPETVFIPEIDTIIHHKPSILENKFMNQATGDYNGDAMSLFSRKYELEEGDEEARILEELQTVLRNLESKMENCAIESEKDIPVDSSTVTKRTIVNETIASILNKSSTPNDFKHADCSDCAVCSTVLMDKFEAMSPSLFRTVDEENKITVSGENVDQTQAEKRSPQKEPQNLETKQRPGMLRHIVGGLLLVGLSVFTVKTIRKNDGQITWPTIRRRRDNSQR